MIQGIGHKAGLAQAAIEAAMRKVEGAGARADQGVARVDQEVARAFESALAKSGAQPSLEGALSQAIGEIDRSVRQSEALPVELLSGRVSDFHEVAGQLKQAEIAFKFSLEVRNKLIDAYRETMRMSV